MSTRISVAMITKNGEKYLAQELDSILKNLGEEDEIVISDDGSTDGTVETIRAYQAKNERIRLVQGPQEGIIANIENVVQKCNGDFIFLADQDDVWKEDKVKKVISEFNKNAVLVMHDAQVFNEDLTKMIMPSFFEYRGCKSGTFANLVKNRYIGCCMAFRKELVPRFLPIPRTLPMHDQWIGLTADLRKDKVVLIREPLLKYRRHEAAASDFSHNSVPVMIKNRCNLVRELWRARKIRKGPGR